MSTVHSKTLPRGTLNACRYIFRSFRIRNNLTVEIVPKGPNLIRAKGNMRLPGPDFRARERMFPFARVANNQLERL